VYFKKLLKNILAIIIILLGIAGLFLPFLQGIIFILIGIGLLDFSRKQSWLQKIENSRLLRPLINWFRRKKSKLKHHFKK